MGGVERGAETHVHDNDHASGGALLRADPTLQNTQGAWHRADCTHQGQCRQFTPAPTRLL